MSERSDDAKERSIVKIVIILSVILEAVVIATVIWLKLSS